MVAPCRRDLAPPCSRSTPSSRSARFAAAAPGWWTRTATSGSTPTAATPWPPRATRIPTWCARSPSRPGRCSSTRRRSPYPLREHLAQRLAALCPDPLSRVFFCNSGAEANENALHLARRWTGRSRIVSVTGGWHGRTLGTLACTDGARYEETAARGGIPLSTKVPADAVAALDAAVDDTVAAVILEPVQGLSGARDLSAEFLRAARAGLLATAPR